MATTIQNMRGGASTLTGRAGIHRPTNVGASKNVTPGVRSATYPSNVYRSSVVNNPAPYGVVPYGTTYSVTTAPSTVSSVNATKIANVLNTGTPTYTGQSAVNASAPSGVVPYGDSFYGTAGAYQIVPSGMPASYYHDPWAYAPSYPFNPYPDYLRSLSLMENVPYLGYYQGLARAPVSGGLGLPSFSTLPYSVYGKYGPYGRSSPYYGKYGLSGYGYGPVGSPYYVPPLNLYEPLAAPVAPREALPECFPYAPCSQIRDPAARYNCVLNTGGSPYCASKIADSPYPTL